MKVKSKELLWIVEYILTEPIPKPNKALTKAVKDFNKDTKDEIWKLKS